MWGSRFHFQARCVAQPAVSISSFATGPSYPGFANRILTPEMQW